MFQEKIEDVNSETHDNRTNLGTTLTSSDEYLKDKLTPAMMHIEDELFESVSKRAWTDLILQLIKVSFLTLNVYFECKFNHLRKQNLCYTLY